MIEVKQYDERAALARVAQGDEDAFRELFNQYRHRIMYFAWKFLQSDTKAEDVLQEIFLKVWINRQQLAEIKNFKAWLGAITRNHIFNALRKLAAEEAMLLELSAKAAIPDPNEILNGITFNELQESLSRAVSNLTPQQKRIFELSRVDGLKQKQIAEQLDISTETVKKHMTDALRKIRLQMKSSESLVHLTILVCAIKF